MASAHFSITPTTGIGNTSCQLLVDSTNTGTADRVATVTVTNGVNSDTVTVRQRFRPRMNQFASTTFPATGGTIYFTVSTEYDIVFRSVPDWITITKNGSTFTEGQRISSGAANGTFELTAAANSGEARSVSATMNMGHYIGNTLQQYVSYFSFTQKASEKILPLTFQILTGGTLVFKHISASTNDVGNLTIQYKNNGGSWITITASTGGTSISVAAGDVVQLRGNNATYSTQALSYTTFSGSTASFSINGNIMSLVNSTGFSAMTVVSNEYQFNKLFAGTRVITAEDLALPATTIAAYGYMGLFENCTQLYKSPELPALTLTSNCYNGMFKGCSNLSHIRCYATGITASNCTYNWVQNVATAGTFVKNTSMTSWTIGNNGIPTNWVTQSYTPTAVTKTLTIIPTMVDVGSADTSTTVTMVVENCTYSSMTYTTGGSFAISVVGVQNGIVGLRFAINSGAMRIGQVNFTLYDTDHNAYPVTVKVSQGAASGHYVPTVTSINNPGSTTIGVSLMIQSYQMYSDSTWFELSSYNPQNSEDLQVELGPTSTSLTLIVMPEDMEVMGGSVQVQVSYGFYNETALVPMDEDYEFHFTYSEGTTCYITISR